MFELEIISIHRINHYDLYSIGGDLHDAIEYIPKSHAHRTQLNPDIKKLNDSGIDYLYNHLNPKVLEDGTLDMWTGIELAHDEDVEKTRKKRINKPDAEPEYSTPKVVGLVAVRPNTTVAVRDSKSNVRKFTGVIIDAWSTTADADESVRSLVEIGEQVASKLFGGQIPFTIEAIPEDTDPGELTLINAVKKVLPATVAVGDIARKEKIGRLTRTKSGILLAKSISAFDIV